jgi:hypothetical protein
MDTKVTTLAVLAASVLIRIVRPDEFTTRRQRHTRPANTPPEQTS